MSQEKVNKYKEEKANRKAIMKKQKIAKIVRSSVASVICVAAVAWIGYSAVAYYQENKPRESVEVDYTAVSDYINSISSETITDEEISGENITIE